VPALKQRGTVAAQIEILQGWNLHRSRHLGQSSLRLLLLQPRLLSLSGYLGVAEQPRSDHSGEVGQCRLSLVQLRPGLLTGVVQLHMTAGLQALDGLGGQLAKGVFRQNVGLDVAAQQSVEDGHAGGQPRARLAVLGPIPAPVVPDPPSSPVAPSGQGDRAAAHPTPEYRAKEAATAPIAPRIGLRVPEARAAGNLDGAEGLLADDGREDTGELLLFGDLPAVAIAGRQHRDPSVDRVLEDTHGVLWSPKARPPSTEVLPRWRWYPTPCEHSRDRLVAVAVERHLEDAPDDLSSPGLHLQAVSGQRGGDLHWHPQVAVGHLGPWPVAIAKSLVLTSSNTATQGAGLNLSERVEDSVHEDRHDLVTRSALAGTDDLDTQPLEPAAEGDGVFQVSCEPAGIVDVQGLHVPVLREEREAL